MKLCMDCKHFVPDTEQWPIERIANKYAICGRTSRVTGKDGQQCMTERDYFWHCGKNARHFEARQVKQIVGEVE